MRSVVGSRINSSVYLCLLIIYPPDVLIILHQGDLVLLVLFKGGVPGVKVWLPEYSVPPLKGATTGDMPL